MGCLPRARWRWGQEWSDSYPLTPGTNFCGQTNVFDYGVAYSSKVNLNTSFIITC